MTVLLAFLNYGPYHVARLTAAQTHGAGSGRHVIGLSMASHQGEYDWRGTSNESILTASPDLPLEQVSSNQWRTLLAPILDQVSPDVCAIAGYSHPSMLTLISLCRERGVPWVLMSDSQEKDEVRRSWQEWIKSRLVRLASSAFAAGRPHLDYLTTLGLPSTVCSTGYDVVDNHYFAREAARWKTQDSTPSPPYFLASNRFIPKKNLFRLLDAYASYAITDEEQRTKHKERSTPWNLCLLGDGELKNELLAHAKSLSLEVVESAPWELETLNLKPDPSLRDRRSRAPSASPTVFLPGFRQIDELPRFYAHAEAFVHASTTEQWGLVVNEAMASGVPVIVSNRCGCAPDLVQEGVNGWTFDPDSVEALALLMNRVSSLPETARTTLGEASRQIIAHWGPERFAKGLHEAAKKALATGPKHGSRLDRLLLRMLILR